MTDRARTLHDSIVTSLCLPASCRVDQRVPKKMLSEQGGATATDRRLLTEGIEEAQWLAVVKPGTAAVPVWRDAEREYLEVVVLSVEVRASHAHAGQIQRLTELIHRAIPYPVLLILVSPGAVTLSLAHKRASLSEAGKVVLDGEITSLLLNVAGPAPDRLLEVLSLSERSHIHLQALYQRWIDCLLAARAESLTGRFRVTSTPEQAERRRAELREYQRMEQEAARLRALAAKDTQIAQRVEHNLALQRVQAELAALRAHL